MFRSLTIKGREILSSVGLLLTAFVWGSGFVAAQIALDAGVRPFTMMSIRFSIACVIMAGIAFRQIKKEFVSHIKPGIVIGIFLFAAFAFQTFGLQYTSPAKNAFLTASNVVIVPFVFWIILKRRPSIHTFVGACFSIVGIALIAVSFRNFSMELGDFLTLISAVLFAFHVVYIGYYTKERGGNPLVLVFFQMGVAALLSFLSAFFFEDSSFEITRTSVLSLVYLGVFSTMLAFLLQNASQKYVVSTTAAILLSTESVFGALLSVWVLGEVLSFKVGVGAAFVLFAVLIAETKLQFRRKKQKSKEGQG